ncbi:MAG: DUF4007 family protein, partial [Acholeplasmataceae bacterium]|nr:DUF4007 family protein [Acholeplasmataceae bacterium]
MKNHWINKGLKALKLEENWQVLIDKHGYKDLGIGKNMQQSLRYWLEATKIIELSDDKKSHKLTHFGEQVDKFDSGCTYYFTLLLIHYFLTTSVENSGEPISHCFYWFFIENKDHFLTKEKIKEGLLNFS